MKDREGFTMQATTKRIVILFLSIIIAAVISITCFTSDCQEVTMESLDDFEEAHLLAYHHPGSQQGPMASSGD